MAHSKVALLLAVVLGSALIECKIVLPHKLRYLENMLNADLLSKATRMRQRTEGTSAVENRAWPVLGLGKYQDEKPSGHPPLPPFLVNNIVQRRMSNPKI
ncbi:uncharacterized protein LOC134678485 [Cydia fagiglandana]|uniref:uncharacterized protein LOC134678485 n=1 Tax=Cydia fagiglandana TaxID=1458189 RepID=UPI002FEE3B93